MSHAVRRASYLLNEFNPQNDSARQVLCSSSRQTRTLRPQQGPLSHQSGPRGLVAGSLLHTTAACPSVCRSHHQGLFARVCHLLRPPRTARTPTSASHPGQRQRHPSSRSAPTLRSRPSPLPPPRLRAARSRVAGQFGSAPATALRRHCQHPCSRLFCRLVYSDGLPHGLPASALVYLSYKCQRDVFKA